MSQYELEMDNFRQAKASQSSTDFQLEQEYISKQQPMASVKVQIMPDGETLTLRSKLADRVADILTDLSEQLKIDSSTLELSIKGSIPSKEATLKDLGVSTNSSVLFSLNSKDPSQYPIKLVKPQLSDVFDVITVKVQQEDGDYEDLIVEIERSEHQKPYLGGWRNKQSGVEYHNATTQAAHKSQSHQIYNLKCRETQTYEQKHQQIQTTNNMATQMTKPGVYISNMKDKLMQPRKYLTAEDRLEIMNKNIVIVQKYYRRWMARKQVNALRKVKGQRINWEKDEEQKKIKEKSKKIELELRKRMNPRSKEDFDAVYSALKRWKEDEQERIDSALSGAERKAALCQLLEKEAQLLANIGKHKMDANQEVKERQIQQYLDKTSKGYRWRSKTGTIIEIETPETLRAKELQEIYSSITMKDLTREERLDALLTLKHTVKAHDCKLTKDLTELIDREADLLLRGFKDNKLEGLRMRISTLFLQFIKTPEFNPEVKKVNKVPSDPNELKKDVHFCLGCNTYLRAKDFQLTSQSHQVGRCRKCQDTDNKARKRQDYNHYRQLLKQLRKMEQAYNDNSKLAFLIQENDLRHLIETIWNGQSIISAWNDMYDLEFVRWDIAQPWSPWNCALLTKDEASIHLKLRNNESYGQALIRRVEQKQTLARKYFSSIPGMVDKLEME